MTTTKDLHRKWVKNRRYKAEYESLGEEFRLAKALIKAATPAVEDLDDAD